MMRTAYFHILFSEDVCLIHVLKSFKCRVYIQGGTRYGLHMLMSCFDSMHIGDLQDCDKNVIVIARSYDLDQKDFS